MRALIISDVHANLAALDAVLADAGAFDAVWCLGDTVGYGPQPAECIDRLRGLGALWVAGNHERAATGAISTGDFNPAAAAAAEWTKRVLTDEEKAALDALPEVAEQGDFTYVHGTLRWPIWEYLWSEEEALAHLDLQRTPFGLVGHTHVPAVAWLDLEGPRSAPLYRAQADAAVTLTDRRRWVLNPGSVGQPRDGDPRAAYAVYDSELASVVWRRVEYDIKRTQSLMEAANLPEWLIKRLAVGL